MIRFNYWDYCDYADKISIFRTSVIWSVASEWLIKNLTEFRRLTHGKAHAIIFVHEIDLLYRPIIRRGLSEIDVLLVYLVAVLSQFEWFWMEVECAIESIDKFLVNLQIWPFLCKFDQFFERFSVFYVDLLLFVKLLKRLIESTSAG